MRVDAWLARQAPTWGLTLCLLGAAANGRAEPSPATLATGAGCHGPGGNSAIAGIPSIAGQPKVFVENQLVLIREGLREVPAMTAVMTGMKDEDIVALAVHFAAQAVTPRSVAADPAKLRAGAELSRRLLCGTCHLSDYAGQSQVPRLAAQDEAYLLLSMKQFRDNPGPGRDTIMASTLRGLTDADLANLAHYLAGSRR